MRAFTPSAYAANCPPSAPESGFIRPTVMLDTVTPSAGLAVFPAPAAVVGVEAATWEVAAPVVGGCAEFLLDDEHATPSVAIPTVPTSNRVLYIPLSPLVCS